MRILGIGLACVGVAIAFSIDRLERVARASDSPIMFVAYGAFLVVTLTVLAGAAFSFVQSSRMDRILARAKAEPGAAWVVEAPRVRLLTPVQTDRRFTFRAGASDRRFLLERALDETPVRPSSEPAPPEPVAAPPETAALSTEPTPAQSEFPELPQLPDEREIKFVGKPPFRVQGVHVAEFAKRIGDRAWKKALLYFVFGGLTVLYTASVLVRSNASFKGDQILGMLTPIALGGAAVVVGRRHLARHDRLQTISESAQADPEAVWGVKDTWLYPLSPHAPRNQLSVTLDANEHRDIYKKPGPPKL